MKMKSIKKLKHTRRVRKRRKDGVTQTYWVGRKTKAKRGFKKLGYRQLKKRGWKGRRFTDTDGDGKVNVFDCKPLDAKRQDFSANTVLQQLGGNKFIAMTGANTFLKDKNSIRFKLPRAKNSIKWVVIKLTSMDLYDITFMTRSGKVVKKVDGIYFDQLQEIFTNNTGLYTHL